MKISVLGCGRWGSFIGWYLINNGHNVIQWGTEGHHSFDVLKSTGKNEYVVLDERIDLPKHMAEHIYMFSGVSERVTIRIDKFLVNDVIDWFGKDVSFYDETEDEVTASVIVNLKAMRYWAMQYANHVEVLRPAELREQIKTDLQNALSKYGD